MVTKARTVSQNGLNYLKGEEGWSAKPYYDDAGIPTIGYGHRIKPGEHFVSITPTEGEALLRSDLQWAEDAVNSLVIVPLNQNQFDALVDVVYNIGEGAFAASTLLGVLNVGDYAGAAAQILRWDKIHVDGVAQVNAGLQARRAKDQQLFLA